jgi:alkylated DNA repair dioxygenase AlkB
MEINEKSNQQLSDKCFSHHPKFFSDKEKNKEIFDELFKNGNWQKEKAIFGNIPTRMASVFAENNSNVSYTYSGKTKPTNDWNSIPLLLFIKKEIEKLTNQQYDFVLLNYYPDGNASIGLHADDEQIIDQNCSIVSVSFGESRNFILKHNLDKTKHVINLQDGDVFIMLPGTQQQWKHEIKKEKQKTKPRISLTFRKHISAQHKKRKT